MSKISIILSTYNGEKYLKAQLNSLFSQSYKNFKLIARDDGSTDGTKEILSFYDMVLLNSSENIGMKKAMKKMQEIRTSLWR